MISSYLILVVTANVPVSLMVAFAMGRYIDIFPKFETVSIESSKTKKNELKNVYTDFDVEVRGKFWCKRFQHCNLSVEILGSLSRETNI